MKELKGNEKELVHIPDEWIPDYSKTEEENLESLHAHFKESEEAWAKLKRNGFKGQHRIRKRALVGLLISKNVAQRLKSIRLQRAVF